MAHLMASFWCSESSMTQPTTLIKVVARGRVALIIFAFIAIEYYCVVPLLLRSQACSHSWTYFIAWVLNGGLPVWSVYAFAVYLEPWHADVFDWLDLRKNHHKVQRSLLCTLQWHLFVLMCFVAFHFWVCYIFCRSAWPLFCPNEAPDFTDCQMLNLIHWPIGIGVQGLADTFYLAWNAFWVHRGNYSIFRLC